MNELLCTIAQPFKLKGTRTLKTTEFIFSLVLDLKWFKPAEAKTLLQTALNNNLLQTEEDNITASFDPTQVNLPLNFKPTTNILEEDEQSLFEKIIERISLQTGLDKRKIIASINQNQEKLSKMVDINVSALIIAIENNVNVKDLTDEAYQELIQQ